MREKSYHLSHPQKRIWYLEKTYKDSQLHNIGGVMRIKGEVDVSLIKQAINLTIKNNEGLRLRFFEIDGEPEQYVKEYETEEIKFLDFTEESEDTIERWQSDNMSSPFVLMDSKLYEFIIFRSSIEDYSILLKMHHLVSDGWSTSIIQKQVTDYYEMLKEKQPVALQELRPSYVTYLNSEKNYLDSERCRKNRVYWMNKFSKLPENMTPLKKDAMKANRVKFFLEKELSQDIFRFLEGKKLSLNSFFTGVMAIYLGRTRDTDDIVVGVPVYNRMGKQEKEMVGMFTSTMPVRVSYSKDMTCDSFFKTVNTELKECLYQQRYPYDMLINDLGLRKAGYESLFDVCVNYYVAKYSDMIDGKKSYIEQVFQRAQWYPLQLVIVLHEDTQKIELDLDYNLSYYNENEIHTIYRYLIQIAKSFVQEKIECIQDISLIPYKERYEKLIQYNNTFHFVKEKKTVVALFEEQVKRVGDKTACMCGDESITYQELSKRINQLANYLVKNGIQNDDIVAICYPHSIDLIVAIFAVLKVGASYVPVDPNYPVERIEYIIEDSNVNLLIQKGTGKQNPYLVKTIDISQIDLSLEEADAVDRSVLDGLAYTIYTSGSTGRPKGVMIEHKGLSNYIRWASKMYFKSSEDVFAFYSSISFDLTITSIFCPLCSGCSMDIYPVVDEEFNIYTILRRNRVTVVKATPSHLGLISKEHVAQTPKLHSLIVGGENLTSDLCNTITDLFHGEMSIYNEYGPTETVVGCMIYLYKQGKDTGYAVPIGKPADNVRIFLLNQNGQTVAEHEEGEIYIAGEGLARGYRNMPDETKRAFLTKKLETGEVLRLYKTGDVAEWIADNNLLYKGRKDSQVKLRGHRIELSEIEKTIVDITECEKCIVTVKRTPSKSEVLCAYVKGVESLDEVDMNLKLCSILPDYMIPDQYYQVENIPLTINGKVDVEKLPFELKKAANVTMPQTEQETIMVASMKSVLGVEEIGIDDDFIALGGDSIKAIQLTSKLDTYHYQIKISDILTYRTPRLLAKVIKKKQDTVKYNPDDYEGTMDLSPIVQYFFSQKLKNPAYYNQSVLIELPYEMKPDDFDGIMRELVGYHDILRTNYNPEKQTLYYQEKELIGSLKGHVYPETIEETEWEDRIGSGTDEMIHHFTFGTGLLINYLIVPIKKEKTRIMISMHHLITDGVSWRIFLEDLNYALACKRENEELVLPKKTTSYKACFRGCGSIQNMPQDVQSIPTDGKVEHPVMKDVKIISRTKSREELALFQEVAYETYHLKLDEALVIAFSLAVSTVFHVSTLNLQLESQGRDQISENCNLSRTMGWFTRIYSACLSLSGDSMNEKVKMIKEGLRVAKEKAAKNALEWPNKDARSVRFNYLGDIGNEADYSEFSLIGKSLKVDTDDENEFQPLLDVNIMLQKEQLQLDISYCMKEFYELTMATLADEFMNQINQLTVQCKEETEITFTPSDFKDSDITQDDLDMLF